MSSVVVDRCKHIAIIQTAELFVEEPNFEDTLRGNQNVQDQKRTNCY